MKLEYYQEQVEKKRQKLEKINQNGKVSKDEIKSSRVERYGRKRKSNIQFPLLTVLSIFFVILPIAVFIIYSSFVK